MTRQLGPLMVHITDQCLAALTGRGPTSTGEVADAIGQPRNEPVTWRALNWLAAHGLITRVDLPDAKSMHWSRVDRADVPAAAELERLLDNREEANGGE